MKNDYKERVYTLETRISKEDAEYFKEFSPEFAKLCRRIWQDLKHDVKTDSKYITRLCHEYNFMKRTVNSALRQMKGRLSALRELQKVQIEDIENKVHSLSEKIKHMSSEIDTLKIKVKNNPNGRDLVTKYRNTKSRLYSLQNKKNKYLMKIRNYNDLSVDTLDLCFGSKKFFNKQYNLKENGYKTHQKWLNDFRKLRDRQIYYVGSSDETCGNQMFQTIYKSDTDKFQIKVRKENNYCQGKNDKYILIDTKFKFRTELLVYMLKEGQTMTYTVTCKNGKWYINVSFRCLHRITTDIKTGCIGLDFNNGFISLVETDRYGNMIDIKDIKLKYHGAGNKAKSEMSELISKIVRYTHNKGKALCIEDLRFSKRKSLCIGKGKRRYNQMIHLLDYSRYRKFCEDYSTTYGVKLIQVNPAYTSKIGKQKYSYKKKITVHDAAAYVIARRGQGYTDYYIKTA